MSLCDISRIGKFEVGKCFINHFVLHMKRLELIVIYFFPIGHKFVLFMIMTITEIDETNSIVRIKYKTF